mmetsp:Transcript_12414/g.37874  ORF Transcript_12414/g.37874 Transcript_12414/m.37874 type:complete len:947 (+) Transcript_12414:90-2930(+)
MAALERQCTVLINSDKTSEFDNSVLLSDLESGTTQKKIDALKKFILMQLNGEPVPQLLMTVIRFVLRPQSDTHLRKLGLYYLEIVDKHGADGKMLPEMILVCNMIRLELESPNEYARGCALRFVCKLHDAEIVEPLVSAIRPNLEHRHSFVRRNAVLAVHHVYMKFEHLIPDAPETIEAFLINEVDIACRRNAFVMLCQCDQERAIMFLHQNIQQIQTWGETLQLSALELIRKVCRQNPMQKGGYIRVIFALLQSPTAAVVYEASSTLISLSNAPTAVRAAAQCFCQLLSTQSDNNVKLILLDRLTELRKNHLQIMQELLMDMLRALTSPNMDIRRKTVALAMDLVTNSNVEEVIGVLKKELLKTQSSTDASAETFYEYRQLLVHALHNAALRYPDVAPTAVHVLTDFLGDSYGAATTDVILFVREIAETLPSLRPVILSKLLEALPTIKIPLVLRGSLWVLGEYSEEPGQIKEAFKTIMENVGRLPFTTVKPEKEEEENEEDKPTAPSGPREKVTVLADGTYATQVAEDPNPAGMDSADRGPTLRNLILNGEFFVGVALCTALTKLALRVERISGVSAGLVNQVKAEAMLVCASLLRIGTSGILAARMNEGSAERIVTAIRALNGDADPQVWLEANRDAFATLVKDKRAKESAEEQKRAKDDQVQAFEQIDFDILRSRRMMSNEENVMDDMDLVNASTDVSSATNFNLARIMQLTGMNDPVYAEAHMTVHQYDIILDIYLVNKTTTTLQNLTVELATTGDLRLCERPQSYTFGPGEQKNIRANIKVSSTETGIIFGNIVYDVATPGGETGCVILNDIHIDVMDYIEPGTVSDVAFRSMWAEFEWENKVAVNTGMTDLSEYLDYIIESTNMRCLTLRGIENESGFLAANLYATSTFGEDALVNVSAEKSPDGSLSGYIRIRSKTQGIALSLGDKITLKQSQKAPRH